MAGVWKCHSLCFQYYHIIAHCFPLWGSPCWPYNTEAWIEYWPSVFSSLQIHRFQCKYWKKTCSNFKVACLFQTQCLKNVAYEVYQYMEIETKSVAFTTAIETSKCKHTSLIVVNKTLHYYVVVLVLQTGELLNIFKTWQLNVQKQQWTSIDRCKMWLEFFLFWTFQ